MNEHDLQPDDLRLRDLLRQARLTPGLPPGFQEGVWRRIERLERTQPEVGVDWLGRLAEVLLRPRLALAGMLVLLLAGAGFGVLSGWADSRQAAQRHYVQSVAPNPLR